MSSSSRQRPLRSGDLVEVKSAQEILATLDERGTLEGLPFMAEMIPLIGQRYTVDRRAEKVCDTVGTYTSRRLKDGVLLGSPRCDGSGHAGCQAECRVFWKEAWLRPVSSTGPTVASGDDAARARLVDLANSNASRQVEGPGGPEPRYRCQATELPAATTHLRTLDPRPYVRELTTGNVALGAFLRVSARAAVHETLERLGLVPPVPVRGAGRKSPPTETLGLKAGDWVQVKSRAEIEATLTELGKNRGLWFDREMLPFCGKKYRVRRKIERFVNERTGELVQMRNDCVTLEGGVCSGELSGQRWFCPRQIYAYWREGWLRRVPPPQEASSADRP